LIALGKKRAWLWHLGLKERIEHEVVYKKSIDTTLENRLARLASQNAQ